MSFGTEILFQIEDDKIVSKNLRRILTQNSLILCLFFKNLCNEFRNLTWKLNSNFSDRFFLSKRSTTTTTFETIFFQLSKTGFFVSNLWFSCSIKNEGTTPREGPTTNTNERYMLLEFEFHLGSEFLLIVNSLQGDPLLFRLFVFAPLTMFLDYTTCCSAFWRIFLKEFV